MCISEVTHDDTSRGIGFILYVRSGISCIRTQLLNLMLAAMCELMCYGAQYVHDVTIAHVHMQHMQIRHIHPKTVSLFAPVIIIVYLNLGHVFYAQALRCVLDELLHQGLIIVFV